ncbi:replication initiation protein, partial [Vibrio sp. 10N.261.51.A1]|uniref:replication initiation protein n=1 Tax=Vibrio sp. 10N.261.51.A1 TaxID=3229672 RepID=UPI00354BAC3B
MSLTYAPKTTAIKKKYLQVNQPKLVTYLIFDIDRQGGVLAWCDNDLPTPCWTSKNPENAHAHIAYRLKVPFCTSDIA